MNVSPLKSQMPAFLRDVRVLSAIAQIIAVFVVVALLGALFSSILTNLAANNLTPNLGFLSDRAGFDISNAPTWYTSDSQYWTAFQVGMMNSLRIILLGLVLTTVLGVMIGIFLLSSNWLVRTIARLYVELVRNTPLLIQLFIWYFVVMFSLPDFRNAVVSFPSEGVLPLAGARLEIYPLMLASVRGFVFPELVATPSTAIWLVGIVIALLIALGLWIYLGKQTELTGKPYPRLQITVALLLLAVVGGWLVALLLGRPPETVTFTRQDGTEATLPLAEAWVEWRDVPGTEELQAATVREPLHILLPRQNINRAGFATGLISGSEIPPEYMALLIGLVVYTAGFIAEIVRAGILAVPRGQLEASRALGLTTTQLLTMIVLPQALRVIIPPLGNQYLNLSKNSSLATAIAYADVFFVTQTIMNQSGQSVTGILMIMAFYLVISLTIALITNIANRRFRIVTR